MKSSRAAIERHVALPPSYDAFLSFPIAKGGYSGVAVYTSALAVPLKAEEGIVGRLQPKPPLSEEERIGSYPTAHELENKLFPDEKGDTPSDLGVLDAEGRGLVLDLGLFVLINVYCPNETSDARLPFKVCFRLVSRSVEGLMVMH
jgi:AP endonuclease-2